MASDPSTRTIITTTVREAAAVVTLADFRARLSAYNREGAALLNFLNNEVATREIRVEALVTRFLEASEAGADDRSESIQVAADTAEDGLTTLRSLLDALQDSTEALQGEVDDFLAAYADL